MSLKLNFNLVYAIRTGAFSSPYPEWTASTTYNYLDKVKLTSQLNHFQNLGGTGVAVNTPGGTRSSFSVDGTLSWQGIYAMPQAGWAGAQLTQGVPGQSAGIIDTAVQGRIRAYATTEVGIYYPYIQNASAPETDQLLYVDPVAEFPFVVADKTKLVGMGSVSPYGAIYRNMLFKAYAGCVVSVAPYPYETRTAALRTPNRVFWGLVDSALEMPDTTVWSAGPERSHLESPLFLSDAGGSFRWDTVELRFKTKWSYTALLGAFYARNLTKHVDSLNPLFLFTTEYGYGTENGYLTTRVVDNAYEINSNQEITIEDCDFSVWSTSTQILRLSPYRPTLVTYRGCKFNVIGPMSADVYDTGLSGARRKVVYIGCWEAGQAPNPNNMRIDSNYFRLTRVFDVLRDFPSKVNGVPFSNFVETPSYLEHYWETSDLQEVEFTLPGVGKWEVVVYVLSNTPLTSGDLWMEVSYGIGDEGIRTNQTANTRRLASVSTGLEFYGSAPVLMGVGQGGDWPSAPVGFVPYRMTVTITTLCISDVFITYKVGGPSLRFFFDPTPDLIRR